MRILFQGAGAIGLAGAALLTDRHEVAVVSRRASTEPHASYPRRVGILDPSASTRGHDPSLRPHTPDPSLRPHAPDPQPGWRVSDVVATRRVTITGWADLLGRGRGSGRARGSVRGRPSDRGGQTDRGRHPDWDLIVLTTRPGDLDSAVTSAIQEISPRFIATTSQVDGDLGLARSLFPAAEVVIFGPAFLSERISAERTSPEPNNAEPNNAEPNNAERPREQRHSHAQPASPGHEVRYWSPAGGPKFLVAGDAQATNRLSRGLGRLVLPVPSAALTLPPAVFIPYVAELSIRYGSWTQLKAHLRRPTRAAVEAVRAVTGLPVPMSSVIARLVLRFLEAVSPIPMSEYAGRHFGRHEPQTLAMLEGWALQAAGSAPDLDAQIRALREKTRA